MTDDGAAPAPEPDAPGERMPKWVPRAVITFWLGLAALWILLGLYQRLKTLLVMIVVSLFLALAIEPGVNALVRRGWRRGLATGFAMLVVTLIGLLFVASVGALIVRQVGDLVDKSPDYLEQLERWINDTFNADVNIDDLVDELTREGGPARELAQRLAGSTLQLSLAALGALLQLFSVLLFTFYLVADGPRFRRTVCSVLRPDLQREVLRGWDLAIDKTGGYLYSRGLLALLSALFHYIAFRAIGLDFPEVLALFVGVVSQFLPVVGTYLAGVLPVLVGLAQSPLKALWVLGFVIVYQQVENYLFAPRISARTMQLHPAIAFASVIAGAALLGPIGAVLALPVAATIQAFISTYVERHDVVESHLTTGRPPARPRGRFGLRKRNEPEPAPEPAFEPGPASKTETEPDAEPP
jgi:predicted PurR-regulated permease PerM